MGTRAIIKLDGFTGAVLYKHYDGYPDATLQWLKDFNNDFTTNRGDDDEYKFAQLIRSSAFDCQKYGLDNSRYTGWGVVLTSKLLNPDDFIYGSEFIYTLYKDGTVKFKQIYE